MIQGIVLRANVHPRAKFIPYSVATKTLKQTVYVECVSVHPLTPVYVRMCVMHREVSRGYQSCLVIGGETSETGCKNVNYMALSAKWTRVKSI